MATIKAKYLGNLRVECIHEQSGTKIITDAPTDNNGKGESFSPTDLCATALGTCIMTIAGMYCQENNIDITGTEIEIDKIMSAEPRRIGELNITFIMPDREYSKKQKTIIERTTKACPVHMSIHTEVKQNFTFIWKR